MTKNLKIKLLVFMALLVSIYIVYSLLKPKSPSPLTEQEKIQELVNLTTAPPTSTPMKEEELKNLINLTTAPSPIINKKNK